MDVMQLAAGLDLGPSFEDLKRAKMQDILRGVQAAQVAPPSPMFSEQPMVPPPQMPQPGPQTPMRPQGLVKALGKGPGAPMPQQAPGGPPGPVPGGPAPVDPAQARLAALQAQMEGLGAVDRSGMEASFKRNQEQGGQGLLLALAAQEAGNQPIASHYLQKARAAGEPIKTAGGTMTEGGFIEDVDYGRQREEAKLQGQIAQQQAIINSNATREEKQRAEKSAQEFQMQLARMNNAAAMGRAQASSGATLEAAKYKEGLKNKPVDTTMRVMQMDNVIKTAQDALADTGWSNTGIVGSVLGKVPGTSAYDYRRTIDTIKGNIGFDRLQQMRDESKTGGALGQVAVRELELLQSTIDSLDEGQSADKQKAAISNVIRQYETAKGAYLKAQAERGGGDAPPATPAAGGGGQIAVNPQTGEKLQLVNGQWVPVQ